MKSSLEALKPSLNTAMQNWIDANCEKPEWEALNTYCGENLAAFMADAAIAVLGGTVDLEAYHHREGDFKN